VAVGENARAGLLCEALRRLAEQRSPCHGIAGKRQEKGWARERRERGGRGNSPGPPDIHYSKEPLKTTTIVKPIDLPCKENRGRFWGSSE